MGNKVYRSLTTSVLQLILLLDISLAKVHQKIYSGTRETNDKFTIQAPPTYPKKNYLLDGDLYIFIIENKAFEGAVKLQFVELYLHPESFMTILDGKYGGYSGHVIGRYDTEAPPPSIISSKSCCLRLEFNIGCCGPAYPGANGFQATVKYVMFPGKGRKENCDGENSYTQLCNGECIPPLSDCPTKIPLPGNMKSRYGTVYGLAVILATLGTLLFGSLTIVCVVLCVEHHRKWRRRKLGHQDDELERMLSSKKLEYTEPLELLQLDANKAKLCEHFIERGLFYKRNDSYSTTGSLESLNI